MSDENRLFHKMKLEKEKIRQLSFKEKIGYFSDYYKWPFIVALIVIVSVILLIKAYVQNNFNTTLNITLVNGSIISTADWQAELERLYGIDGEKNRIVFNKGNFTESEDAEVNMSTYNKLFSNFYSKEVDVYIGTKTDVTYFAGQKYFEDLSTFLDKEMYDELLSRDMIFFVQKTEYDNEEKPYLKDIPVGIIINDTAGYKNSGVVMGKDTDAIMCAASTSTNKENIKTFIKYMLE